MAISLKDITRKVTPEEILDLFLQVADDMGLPITAWQTGEPVRAILEIVAKVFATIWNEGMVPLLAIPLLDYCVGVVLTLVAASLFGTVRYDATFAEGPALLTNQGASFFTFAPGDVRVLGDNGKTFSNRTGGTLPQWDGVSAYPTLELQFIAEEVGANSTLVASSLRLVSGQISVVATQLSAWVGQDGEADENLRVRCRGAAAANGTGGPKLAYDYVLRSTKRTDGTTIPVTRVKTLTPPGDGTLAMYVATPSGEVANDDLVLLQAAIVARAEPLCTTATVYSAVLASTTISAIAYIKKGSAASNDVIAAGKSALLSFFRSADIGGFKKSEGQSFGLVYKNEIGSIISEAHPAVYAVDVAGNDIPIGFDGVPAIASISILVQQVGS